MRHGLNPDGTLRACLVICSRVRKQKNQFDTRRDSILCWKDIAVKHISESDDILLFAEALQLRGVKLYDSLHVACAFVGGCDFMLSTDKKLTDKPITEINVCKPIDFVREMED